MIVEEKSLLKKSVNIFSCIEPNVTYFLAENDKIEDKFCGSKDDEDQGSVGNGDSQNDPD